MEYIYIYIYFFFGDWSFSLLSPPPESESFNNIIEEEELFKVLYDSIKSYDVHCSKCQNCINNVIQSALKVEDVEESSAKFSYEDEKDVPKKCYEVLYKFLNLHIIRCPACMNYVREVTIQHAPKQSTTLVQASTPSIHGTGEFDVKKCQIFLLNLCVLVLELFDNALRLIPLCHINSFFTLVFSILIISRWRNYRPSRRLSYHDLPSWWTKH